MIHEVCRCCGSEITMMVQEGTGYCSQFCQNGRCGHAKTKS